MTSFAGKDLGQLLDFLHSRAQIIGGYEILVQDTGDGRGPVPSVTVHPGSVERAQQTADALAVHFTLEGLSPTCLATYSGERAGVEYTFMLALYADQDAPGVVAPAPVVVEDRRGRTGSSEYDALLAQCQATPGEWVFVKESKTGAGNAAMKRRGCKTIIKYDGDTRKVYAKWEGPVQ